MLKWRVVALALFSVACAAEDSGLSSEQFVDVVVALRQAADAAGSAEAFAPRREAILREAGVTEAQLQAFVRRGVRDPKRLAEAWDSAAMRLRAAVAEQE